MPWYSSVKCCITNLIEESTENKKTTSPVSTTFLKANPYEIDFYRAPWDVPGEENKSPETPGTGHAAYSTDSPVEDKVKG